MIVMPDNNDKLRRVLDKVAFLFWYVQPSQYSLILTFCTLALSMTNFCRECTIIELNSCAVNPPSVSFHKKQ